MTNGIRNAIEYLYKYQVDIPLDVIVHAVKAGALKSESDLTDVRARYNDAIIDAIVLYFEGGSLVAARNSFKRAATEAFGAAVDTGWEDGGETPPLDAELLSWFNARVNEEYAHIDSLFEQIKMLKKEPDFDYFSWATQRADGYTSTLREIYNHAVLAAKGGQLLTWRLGNTEVHCDTCKKLDGGSHRASWYIGRDYIPGKPGAAMDCHGYNCDCKLFDKNGKLISI